MLIEFSVQNYLSFKNPVTFTMVASSVRRHAENNVFPVTRKLSLLKSAVIYGANASGKTNLFQAMHFMKDLVRNSSKATQVGEKIDAAPFRLSTETENMPSVFEIIFIRDGIRYRYGFEADHSKIHNEWLFYVPGAKETKLFVREDGVFEIGTHFTEGKGLESKTRDNALFLSVAAQFNGEISKAVLKWFGNFNIISGFGEYGDITTEYMEKGETSAGKIGEFLKVADLGIEAVNIDKAEAGTNIPKSPGIPKTARDVLISKETDIKTLHQKYDRNKKIVGFENFGLKENESKGAQKIFSLAGPILNTLSGSEVLVADEMDAGLHPLITKFIIQLFNSEENNPNNAQLIFNTHTTNVLDRNLFRRDQIWFTEKDRYGSTDLYSLLDYKVKNSASYGKDYILGRYGAIPYIDTDEFRSLISSVGNEGKTDG
ncbi:ATP-binding protein [Desulfobacterales bacterium HSG2]|nr:ATP-binding protein [Desulfobacterales bacterium HSG2]